MKFFGILLVLGLILVLLGGVYYVYQGQLKPVQSEEEFYSVIIPKGASAQRVGELLEEDGLIRNSSAFRVYVKLKGKEGGIRAGQFRLNKNWSLPEIVDFLGEGGFEGVWVTVVEGWRRSQVGLAFDKALKSCEGSSDEESDCFSLEQFLDLTTEGEGYLFPDTYLVPYTSSAESVVKLLVDTFNNKTASVINDSIKPPEPLDHKSVVILASLLEREAAKDEDLPVVAGILLNRLREDWPLQVDATLQYIVATDECAKPLLNSTSGLYPVCSDWWPKPFAGDKAFDSPFNTYKYTGLPPSPIASPGLATIQAVMNPVMTDYWFYLTDNDGMMRYSETLEEHNANVERYLK